MYWIGVPLISISGKHCEYFRALQADWRWFHSHIDFGAVGWTVWQLQVKNLQEQKLRRRSQNTGFRWRREACPEHPWRWLWWWPWRSTPAASPSTFRLRPGETSRLKTGVWNVIEQFTCNQYLVRRTSLQLKQHSNTFSISFSSQSKWVISYFLFIL